MKGKNKYIPKCILCIMGVLNYAQFGGVGKNKGMDNFSQEIIQV